MIIFLKCQLDESLNTHNFGNFQILINMPHGNFLIVPHVKFR
jgi:hypothetical protein